MEEEKGAADSQNSKAATATGAVILQSEEGALDSSLGSFKFRFLPAGRGAEINPA